MTKYYLAYGSNLNLSCMMKRCPFSKIIGRVKLHNYRLVYKGNNDEAAFLTIEKTDNGYVPMGLFEVTDSDIQLLDIYEGYPNLYSKKYINVMVDGIKVKAFIYVMNDNYTYHKPSNHYLDICRQGYKDFNFDLGILDKAYNDTLEILNNKKIFKKKKKY